MARTEVETGYSQNGLPYVRIGNSSRKLVVFSGLDFEHRPPSGLNLRMAKSKFKHLIRDFTVYLVSRKPGLPEGYSLRDMSDDYAVMIKEEIGAPVDVMGMSTGGVIAQYFAVDHPELIRRLVLALTGYRLTEEGAELQKRMGDLARQGKWRAAYSVMMTGIYPSGFKKFLFKCLVGLFGGISAPKDPSDGLVEIEAEDKHDFWRRLPDIKTPTLVIGGDEDYFYPIAETAERIPNARLVLYEGFGHNVIFGKGRQFDEDVWAFLTEGG
ncbi:MAG TPA: alpha/beta hydrolase [Dehalococcoidales bacterium]|nr:alpha/beta hydrolase [Dehalococcoidales bacterium]